MVYIDLKLACIHSNLKASYFVIGEQVSGRTQSKVEHFVHFNIAAHLLPCPRPDHPFLLTLRCTLPPTSLQLSATPPFPEYSCFSRSLQKLQDKKNFHPIHIRVYQLAATVSFLRSIFCSSRCTFHIHLDYKLYLLLHALIYINDQFIRGWMMGFSHTQQITAFLVRLFEGYCRSIHQK